MRRSCYAGMSDDFVPLALFLRPSAAAPAFEHSPLGGDEELQAPEIRAEPDENFRAARLFRAALADALDVAVGELLQTIARDVLARELQLDAACVAGIVASALDRHAGEKVLSIRAHPSDIVALSGAGLELIADGALGSGDILIELRSGTIDLTVNARLDAALAASAA
jgi:hypothetical protein